MIAAVLFLAYIPNSISTKRSGCDIGQRCNPQDEAVETIGIEEAHSIFQ